MPTPRPIEEINKELQIKRQKQAKKSWITEQKAKIANFAKRKYPYETVIKFN